VVLQALVPLPPHPLNGPCAEAGVRQLHQALEAQQQRRRQPMGGRPHQLLCP